MNSWICLVPLFVESIFLMGLVTRLWGLNRDLSGGSEELVDELHVADIVFLILWYRRGEILFD